MIPLSYSISSIRKRFKSTFSITIGIALFVFVICVILMLREGIHQTIVRTNDPNTLVVMSNGAGNEMSSFISVRQADELQNLPAVAKSATSIREFVILKLLETADHESAGNVIIRGIDGGSVKFRRELSIVAGRAPSAGADEVAVGQLASDRFANLRLGNSIELAPKRKMRVVGVFQIRNSSFASEIWGDLDVIRDIYGRDGVISSIRVRVEPGKQAEFATQVAASKLPLRVVGEAQFSEEQAAKPKQFVAMVGLMLSFFNALAAVIAVGTVMQTVVDSRRNEIVALRRIGFSRRSVLVAFLREAILLGIFGSIAGVLLSLAVTGFKASVMSVSTWSQLIVSFAITPEIALFAFTAGVSAAVAGAAIPAFRSAQVFQNGDRAAY